MGINKIYKIEKENILVEIGDFVALPDLKDYAVAYVGKHKAISPLDQSQKPTIEDMDKDLLIECRLFNESEEIFLFSKGGILKQRIIKSGEGSEIQYIDKKIQLRLGENEKKRQVCIVRHYIGAEGYNIQRYIKNEMS